ncbi:MAG: inositol monophosphatase, partial [Planctomycetaceae bacterium]|nr:inositol monophosphatase [Planctomycetaceae bacterium]
IALDPIDGTKQYRDQTGNGYAVMLHLRSAEEVLYSLVYLPAQGPYGSWMEAGPDGVRVGPDDLSRPARTVLDAMKVSSGSIETDSRKIYLIGFQKKDVLRAEQVTEAGLEGVAPEAMPGSIYPLMASGEFSGSLIHTPNVYDYPVSWQIATALGGDSVWVQNGKTVNFREMWMDERADMLRLPGIVATSTNREHLKVLVDLARDWSPVRYEQT